MTSSPTPSELLAIRTANAALLNSPDASVDMVATIVFALGAAGLLVNRAAVTVEEALRIEETNPATAFTHDCGIPLTRRLDCGHCPHEVCQDCDRCPHSCRCATPLHETTPRPRPVPHDLPEVTA